MTSNLFVGKVKTITVWVTMITIDTSYGEDTVVMPVSTKEVEAEDPRHIHDCAAFCVKLGVINSLVEINNCNITVVESQLI